MATSLGIAYNMNTQEVLENLGERVTWPDKSILASNHGTRVEFIEYIYTKDSATKQKLYTEDFELTYGDNDPRYLDQVYDASGVIVDSGTLYDFYEATGFSFAPEEVKNWLKIYVESKVYGSGSLTTEFDKVNLFDIVNIKVESWLPDMSAIDTSDNSSIVGIIKHPQIEIPVEITLNSGECTALHQFGTAGRYQLPEAGQKIAGYRVSEYLNVDVYMKW